MSDKEFLEGSKNGRKNWAVVEIFKTGMDLQIILLSNLL